MHVKYNRSIIKRQVVQSSQIWEQGEKKEIGVPVVCWSWLIPISKTQLCPSFPNSLFSDIMLVGWNQPWCNCTVEIGKRSKSSLSFFFFWQLVYHMQPGVLKDKNIKQSNQTFESLILELKMLNVIYLNSSSGFGSRVKNFFVVLLKIWS